MLQSCAALGVAPFASACAAEPSAAPRKSAREPASGILFYAKHGFENNAAAAKNPHVAGAVIQFYWSNIEPEPGRYDWSSLESRIRPWIEAGKKVALRIYWIASGNWPDPAAKHPTPAWVWEAGAKLVRHEPSKTEIPLPWDLVYRKYARRFLEEIARKFDRDSNVLFFDVTPGAETNPYRYLAINRTDPTFKTRYAAAAASDGRTYSDELWLDTVREHVNFASRTFPELPLLVTLNVGSLNLTQQHDYAVEIGDYCVERGLYVGQNGLAGSSYQTESPRRSAFRNWSTSTKVFFETLGDAGSTAVGAGPGGKPLGTLREIIDAARRAGASFLLPYPRDVLRGTAGQPGFQPEFAEALEYGAGTLGQVLT